MSNDSLELLIVVMRAQEIATRRISNLLLVCVLLLAMLFAAVTLFYREYKQNSTSATTTVPGISASTSLEEPCTAGDLRYSNITEGVWYCADDKWIVVR